MIRRLTREFANGRSADAGHRAEQTMAPSGCDRARALLPGYHVPKLLITRGRGVGRDEAVGTRCVLGRSSGADIVLQDRGVSRWHARVGLQGEVYVIHDLASRNGTIVNGQRVRAVPLGDGDVIRLGRIELVFRLRETVVGATPAGETAAQPSVANVTASRETGPGETPSARPTTSASRVVPTRHGRTS
jgi:predicted component of type VI protein secretion system